MAMRNQLLQPPVTPTTQPRPETSIERSCGQINRLQMDKQGLATFAYRDSLRRTDRPAPPILVPTRTSGATKYHIQSPIARHCIPSSLPAWLYLRRGTVSASLALFTGIHREARIPNHQSSKTRPKYIVYVTTNTNPWIKTMTKPYLAKIMGSY
jgi:hypothetical protein